MFVRLQSVLHHDSQTPISNGLHRQLALAYDDRVWTGLEVKRQQEINFSFPGVVVVVVECHGFLKFR